MSRCENFMCLANKNLSCFVTERISDRRLRKQKKKKKKKRMIVGMFLLVCLRGCLHGLS